MTPQPKKNKKLIFLIVGIPVFLFIILPILFVIVIAALNADPESSNSEKTSNSQSANPGDAQPSEEARNAPPAGYVTLNKLCYSIQVPEVNDAGEDNACRFSARFGADKLASIKVTQFTKNGEGLDANVAELMRSETAVNNNTLVSEEDILMDNVPAKKLVFKGSGQYGITTAHYLVATDKYKIDGVPVAGFNIIAPSYDQGDNSSIIDTIISSWLWK